MAENAEHGPGTLPREGKGPIKQHQMEARGDGVMAGESFGVSPYPGRDPIKGDRGVMGRELSEKDRHPNVKLGGGYMDASRNPDHGPHMYRRG